MKDQDQLKDSISNWLQEHRTEGTKLLQRLVQAQSTQGNEAGAQTIVIETLTKMGLVLDVWDPDGKELQTHPDFASSKVHFDGSPNVVGILKGTGDGRSIILNGHIDVVPAGDSGQWEDDPYSGKIVDGKMYGRGVTDMKGGNVSLLLAIQAIQALSISLKGDVIFESVIEEESGGTGTLASIVRGYKADAAIIPEPTNMKIFPKQQGSMWFRIYIKGRSAHGGTRYEGISAIEKSMMVINHLSDLEKIRNSRITDPLYKSIPIPIPINIGKIEGGDWPSSVPDLVKLEGRIGVSPNETMDEAKRELEQWIENIGEVDEWFVSAPPTVEWFGARWHPGSIKTDHELVASLTENYQLVLREEPIVEASPWGTDGGLLTNVGKVPTIVFGPGVTEKAHFPNEYIELDNVFLTAEIIALTLIDWCGVGNVSINKKG
ncbi:peptidase [Alkalihalobacillus sp. MEB130]|uniref:peptidase n=1 Tax=Alkalihalobacillus sp. MEB130 TaxID=2976704 RepID=UPI0028DE15CB|nr:peptidase [Alkalihalobacillus sp. MEB130]MDT8861164.1 peptidase [Alkalihalobacillus sp. MEB130]